MEDDDLPRGVFLKRGLLYVRFRIPGQPGEVRERCPDYVTSPRKAEQYRATALAKYMEGRAALGSKRVRVGDALDAVLADYRANERDTLVDAEHRAGILRAAIGNLLASAVTTSLVQKLQAEWLKGGRSAGTVNHICNVLRRGLRLLAQETPPRVQHVPYIPRLKAQSPRGQRITSSEADAIVERLPLYLRDPFRFAIATGIRRGQLSRTLRRYVDLDGECITWPGSETKSDEEHAVPLVGDSLDVVQRAMASAVPWCPYLFHGPRCVPGRKRKHADESPRWGCVGDFKNAWSKALDAAGVGHRRFHDARVTFATESRASGLSEGDCMVLGGWKTRAVFERYNLGDVDALRARLAAAREQRATVVRIADKRRKAGAKP
jgi:integrase